ncbi:MAG: hypothetical protein BGO27_01025 [Alphaproteobacteria bacterium 33-17]|nr:MAG: hypothetical protein BGO27_01025 [Alphaproteobacteria bacterium 33-17]
MALTRKIDWEKIKKTAPVEILSLLGSLFAYKYAAYILGSPLLTASVVGIGYYGIKKIKDNNPALGEYFHRPKLLTFLAMGLVIANAAIPALAILGPAAYKFSAVLALGSTLYSFGATKLLQNVSDMFGLYYIESKLIAAAVAGVAAFALLSLPIPALFAATAGVASRLFVNLTVGHTLTQLAVGYFKLPDYIRTVRQSWEGFFSLKSWKGVAKASGKFLMYQVGAFLALETFSSTMHVMGSFIGSKVAPKFSGFGDFLVNTFLFGAQTPIEWVAKGGVKYGLPLLLAPVTSFMGIGIPVYGVIALAAASVLSMRSYKQEAGFEKAEIKPDGTVDEKNIYQDYVQEQSNKWGLVRKAGEKLLDVSGGSWIFKIEGQSNPQGFQQQP